ncbi:MAG: metallopeptidase family protein [Proteobacteria bacterium]|nr:metallopeptidase family protein [Pseudomonadota bacterium]
MFGPEHRRRLRRRPPVARAGAARRPDDWFVRLVEEAMDELPGPFAAKVENVAVVVERAPDGRTRAEMGLGPGDLLMGLYQGVPLPERSVEAPPIMPDRIVIYEDPIVAVSRDPAAIKRQVIQTVIHEVGHYFGLSDREMAEFEESGP